MVSVCSCIGIRWCDGCGSHRFSRLVPGLDCWGMGIATFLAPGKGRWGIYVHGGCIEVTAVMEGRSACPFSLAFWYCLHKDLSSLHWGRRAWYVSWDWSWSQIQSLALWYHTAYCRTMIFSISCVSGWGEHALGDEGGYVNGQGMDTLIRELVVFGEEVIPEVPEMLPRLYSCCDAIKG